MIFFDLCRGILDVVFSGHQAELNQGSLTLCADVLPTEPLRLLRNCHSQHRVYTYNLCLNPLDPTDFPHNKCYFPRVSTKFPQNSPRMLSKYPNSKPFRGLPIHQKEIISVHVFENAFQIQHIGLLYVVNTFWSVFSWKIVEKYGKTAIFQGGYGRIGVYRVKKKV